MFKSHESYCDNTHACCHGRSCYTTCGVVVMVVAPCAVAVVVPVVVPRGVVVVVVSGWVVVGPEGEDGCASGGKEGW